MLYVKALECQNMTSSVVHTQYVAVATAQSWWMKEGPLIIEHFHS
jgi:hypothetical protein